MELAAGTRTEHTLAARKNTLERAREWNGIDCCGWFAVVVFFFAALFTNLSYSLPETRGCLSFRWESSISVTAGCCRHQVPVSFNHIKLSGLLTEGTLEFMYGSQSTAEPQWRCTFYLNKQFGQKKAKTKHNTDFQKCRSGLRIHVLMWDFG